VDLPFVAPLDAAGLLDFLAARAVPGIEAVEGARYRRAGFEVEVRDDRVRLREGDPAVARRLLALDVDPAPADAALRGDPLLGAHVAARPGMRVPGTVDGFELAVRAIVGQQVSVAGARTVLGRLASGCGTLPRFPGPDAVLAAPEAAFAMPASRRRALRALAAAARGGALVLDPPAPDLGAARASLVALPGIGPWTAEYVALRALGDPDAFQPTDLGVLRALRALGGPEDPRGAAEHAERWRPWRSFAQVRLWAQG
jgi:AraC family transcriptional regulator of adaptative response / DNA-3-methyladenine glycosylase II